MGTKNGGVNRAKRAAPPALANYRLNDCLPVADKQPDAGGEGSATTLKLRM